MKWILLITSLLPSFHPVLASDITLVPFTENRFEAFIDGFIADYAEALLQSHKFNEYEQAKQAAAIQISLSFPEGFSTSNQFLFEITKDTQAVGMLWYAENDSSHHFDNIAWVCNLEIDPPFQRKGYAKAALLEVEKLLKNRSIKQVGLNVFEHTPNAKKLYESLGYTVKKTCFFPNSTEISNYLLVKDL
jgi:ribosomal protein S18 acetylase RimI-like enzyme